MQFPHQISTQTQASQRDSSGLEKGRTDKGRTMKMDFNLTPVEWAFLVVAVIMTIPMLFLFNYMRKELMKDHHAGRAGEDLKDSSGPS